MPARPAARSLFYGDNLDVLRTRKIPDETVDLCYMDPPFNSKRSYFQIYNNIGKEDLAQARAFVDMWTWNDRAIEGFDDILTNGQGRFSPKLVDLIQGLSTVLGEGSLLAYLVSMSRLVTEIHRVLKPTGSYYLHCDPTASHYLKIVLDAIFCSQGGDYRSEVIWRRTGAHNKAERWGPIHDVLFFYTKSDQYTWNSPHIPHMRGHVKEYLVEDGQGGYRTNYYGNVLTGSGIRNGESGKPWKGVDPTAKRRHWAVPSRVWEEVDIDPTGLTQHQKLDVLFKHGVIKIEPDAAWPIYELKVDPNRGPATADIWSFQPYTSGTVYGTDRGIDEDVRWLSPRDRERLGYPTQKPEGLLERIIRTSSKEDGVVLDPCAGCGTTIAVAQRLKRKWIGIDITYQSISLILWRLEKAFGPRVLEEIALDGIPRDMESARALANKKDDRLRKEFEKWAVLTYTNNRAVINEKKGADGGIDGRAYFKTGTRDNAKIILQVKSGDVQRDDVAKLRGDMAKEKAEIGFLLTLEEPTRPMLADAKNAGVFKHEEMGRSYDRIAVIKIQDLIEENARLQIPMSLDALAKARAAVDVVQPDLDLSDVSTPESPEQRDLPMGKMGRRMKKAGLPDPGPAITQRTDRRKKRA